jgi:hypothetical protein
METETQKQIVKIDHAEYGVEESKATQIAEQFKPMLEKMIELETEYNDVVALDINDPMTTFKAKELRLKYVKVRTGTAEIHKQQKEFYLKAGKFIDGWKNAQLFASEGIETRLKEIENHYEIQQQKIRDELAAKRTAELLQYEFDGSQMNLGTMEPTIWENFLQGTKLGFEAKKAEEKRLAEEKAAKEKAEAEEKQRLAAENAKLKAEAEAKEKQLAEERAAAKKEADKKEAIRLAEQKKADELLEAQRKIAEAKAKKEKEIADAKLKAEREAKEKLEAELKAKQDAERKAEEAKQAEIKAQKAAEEKAAKAPDKEKLTAWLGKFSLPVNPELKNEESKDVAITILEKHAAFIAWANAQINTL